MSNIFTEFYHWLEKSEKETLIGKSGSTKDGKNERLRSGQSYLYQSRGMESEVIEIRFHKKVWGSRLNRALNDSMKRYPYLNTRLIEKDGDFYIVQNDVAHTARLTQKLPKLGGISCGYHLVAVTYCENRVYVSFHHALCDGRGIKPFVETLIYYYCRYRYNSVIEVDGVRKCDEPLLEGETAEPFEKKYEYDETKEFISLSRDAFAIPENVKSEEAVDHRYELTLPLDEFMAVCKGCDATPVILLSLLMSEAVSKLYPDHDKAINANIATDMREGLGVPNTYKNCVKSMVLPYDRELAELPLEEQAKRYRGLLKAQRDKDFCRREANAMLALYDKLDGLPSYEAKQKIMTFFEGMTLDTYIISYLGRMILGENRKYIDGIHLYNSGTTGLGMTVVSCGNKLVIDFKQNFPSDKYVKAFVRGLERLDLTCTVSGVIDFATPRDALIKRKNNEEER